MDEYLLNDLLECSVCLERLDTSSKVLPCQHTFCKKCLSEIVAIKRELRCPECRVLVNTSIEELPPNVLLMRILEGMRHAGNPLPKKKQLAVSKQSTTPVHTPIIAPSCLSYTNTTDIANLRPHPANKPGYAVVQPMARALYDYQSLEPVDLNFKKGDLITLKSKIDTHWAQGECSGRIGMFPLTFVQVLTPLQPQAATCRALYDFRMNNDEVEGCLSFRKDEMLAVLRRVDENWIEGRLGGRIGMFPLAFVELNPVARALMKLSSNEQPGPSRLAPPTPTSDDSTPLIPTDSRAVSAQETLAENRVILSPPTRSETNRSNAVPTGVMAPTTRTLSPSTIEERQAQSNTSPACALVPRNVGSDSSSTSTTTPNSSGTSGSSGSSSSSTEPSSPASPQPQQQQQQPQSSISQSLNPFMRPQTILLPTSHITTQQTRDKRHSFTALTSSHPPPSTNRHSAEILSCDEPVPSLEEGVGSQLASGQTPRDSSFSPNGIVQQTRDGGAGPAQQPNTVAPLVRQGSQRHRRSDSDFALIVLPAAYVALYPYKPQKPDELELKKGGVYLVTERCQDGWFKGTSNRTQKCGVFPGNYVTLAKPAQNSHSRVVSSSPRESSTPAAMAVKSRTTASGLRPSATCGLAPPELPPRSASPALRPHRHQWAFPSPPVPEPETVLVDIPSGPAPAVPSKSESTQRHNSQVSNTVSPPPNVSVSLSPMSPKTAEKIKEKKEKCGLMKRLAAIKRSKSPTLPSYSMDNPVFEDASVPNSSNVVHSVHSRSGSCPSQLMQLPIGSQSQRGQSTSLSARVTRHKERPSVAAAQFSHAPRTADCCSTSPLQLAGSHRKSSSLDAGDPRSPKPLVPSVRERFRCIVPYPPNSEYELELRIGDIIYVHRKREDGWYKGTQQRTGRTGLFPASFVETY